MLQMAKLFIFSIFGSGDVQPWDSLDSNKKANCTEETERVAQFTIAGDTTESDESSDNDSYINASDSKQLLQ